MPQDLLDIGEHVHHLIARDNKITCNGNRGQTQLAHLQA